VHCLTASKYISEIENIICAHPVFEKQYVSNICISLVVTETSFVMLPVFHYPPLSKPKTSLHIPKSLLLWC
jgi:hypothetical protein